MDSPILGLTAIYTPLDFANCTRYWHLLLGVGIITTRLLVSHRPLHPNDGVCAKNESILSSFLIFTSATYGDLMCFEGRFVIFPVIVVPNL